MKKIKRNSMSDLKVPVALVFAMAIQLAAGVWWVSKQAHTIQNLESKVKTMQQEIEILIINNNDLIDFATFTENKWAEAYDEDPSYIRKFGTK
jgi:hypothetical protein